MSAVVARLLGAGLLGMWSAAALAALTDELQGSLEAALAQPTPEAVAAALPPVFAAAPTQAVEIATEGASIAPGSCGLLMRAGSAAAPDLAVDIAAGIIAVAPGCEDQVAQILSEVLEAAAGPEDLAPAAGDAPGFPAPNPITTVSTTAENPSTVATSPTVP